MVNLSYILFYKQSKNREAGEAALRVAQAYDSNLTVEKSLRLEIKTDETILGPWLLFLWGNRKQKKQTTLFMMWAALSVLHDEVQDKKNLEKQQHLSYECSWNKQAWEALANCLFNLLCSHLNPITHSVSDQ